MRLVVLCVGKPTPDLSRHCDQFRQIATMEYTTLDEATPGSIKSALARLDAQAVVVCAADGAVNLIVNRLQRNDRLSDTPMLVIPSPDSALVDMAQVPHYSPAEAMARLQTGIPRRALMRDDHGGVVLTEATLTPWNDKSAVRAYVDDTELHTHTMGRLTVRPGVSNLAVTESGGHWWKRQRHVSGRAFTVSCDQARLTVDGTVHPRPQRNRTWWIEPDSWAIAVLD